MPGILDQLRARVFGGEVALTPEHEQLMNSSGTYQDYVTSAFAHQVPRVDIIDEPTFTRRRGIRGVSPSTAPASPAAPVQPRTLRSINPQIIERPEDKIQGMPPAYRNLGDDGGVRG